LSFVSTDFREDLETAVQDQVLNSMLKEFVLPDYKTVKRGYVREPEA